MISTVTLVTVLTFATAPADATARREHCGITADVATSLGIANPLVGRQQIRIGVTAPAAHVGKSANCTVSEIIAGSQSIAIYPNSSGTATNGGVTKLFNASSIPAGAQATLFSVAPSKTTLDGVVTNHFAEPSGLASKSFVEVAGTGSGNLLVFAPHGANIEVSTGTQLTTLRSRLTTLGEAHSHWEAQGKWGNSETFRRWHITAPDINDVSFPGLESVVDTYGSFTHAVALHGFDWDESTTVQLRGIIIGGRAPRAVKQAIRTAIVAAVDADLGAGVGNQIAYYIADTPQGDQNFIGADGNLALFSDLGDLRGEAVNNLVNRLSAGGNDGIQLEQSRGIRENATLANAVAKGLANALAAL